MNEKVRQALDEQRHQETLGALTELSTVLKSLQGKKDDSAIQQVLQKNAELINKFGNKLDDFSKPDAPEVNVSVNQEIVVSEITGSGSVEGTFYGTASLAADISSSSTLSPENLAAAVWNSIAASFNTAGTMGAKMNSAASAGDPWSTALPGAYADGEAGKILAQIQTLVDELHRLQGLDPAAPVTITPTSRTAAGIDIVIGGDGETISTLERQ